MSVSSIVIDDSIRKACPDVCLGCLTYAVTVQNTTPELWAYYEAEVAASLQTQLASNDLRMMPQIAPSRAAYKAFGIDPGRYRISSEALYRRIRQGKDIYRINSLVDVNNLVSLETGYSLGSYDTKKVGPDIVFRTGYAGEVYAGIGKADITLEHMPILADSMGPFGSPTSDSTRGMITASTHEGLTVIYAFSGRASLAAGLALAVDRFSRFANITGLKTFIV